MRQGANLHLSSPPKFDRKKPTALILQDSLDAKTFGIKSDEHRVLKICGV